MKKNFGNPLIVLSVSTISGFKYAKKIFQKRIITILAPFDFIFCIKKFFYYIKPNFIIYIETEIWPNWILYGKYINIPSFFINARISQKSLKKYLIIKKILSKILNFVCYFISSSMNYKKRLIKIGVISKKIFVNRNAKFDVINKNIFTNKTDFNIFIKSLKNRPIFFAGSISKKEESFIIDFFLKLKYYVSNILLVIVPKNIKRSKEIQILTNKKKLTSIVKSKHTNKKSKNISVFIVDSIGELAYFYSFATVVFCGGSLVKNGGHNIYEPLIWGKPVFFGPFMYDFEDISKYLSRLGCTITLYKIKNMFKKILKIFYNISYYKSICKMGRNLIISKKGIAKKQTIILGRLFWGKILKHLKL